MSILETIIKHKREELALEKITATEFSSKESLV